MVRMVTTTCGNAKDRVIDLRLEDFLQAGHGEQGGQDRLHDPQESRDLF
jgi:hypothetical protein